MKTGVILPTFRPDADEARSVARQAEAAGVDGVFCFDHLWPMGQPERPALAPFPVLAAVAASTERICVGTTVARIGLVPEAVLVAEFCALQFLAPGRVVAGLGTGDSLSRRENEAYGVPFDPAEQRRGSLWVVAETLRHRGIPVWVGAGSPDTNRRAGEAGVALNLWDATPDQVAAHAAGRGGDLGRALPGDRGDTRRHVGGGRAGARPGPGRGQLGGVHLAGAAGRAGGVGPLSAK